MKKFIAFAFVLTVAALAVGYAAGRDDLLSDWGIDLTPSAEGAPVGAPGPGAIQVLDPAPSPDRPERTQQPVTSPPQAPRLHPVTPVDPGGEGEPVELSPLGANWSAEKVVVLFETHEAPSPPAAAPEAPSPPAAAPQAAAQGAVGLRAYFDGACRSYAVQPGDVLSRLGKRFQVPWELLMRVNGMKTADLMAGAVIRVVQGPFAVRVDCSERTLHLMAGETRLKTYAVAVGPGTLTPRGRFEVQSKLKNPQWTNPETHEVVPFGHPENPLGTRWIGFTPGFGIHGTNDPASIGTATSKGCIRMGNRDAEEVYDFLVGGAVVEIVD